MSKFTIIVEWNDMPFGFKSWLLNLRRNKGMAIKQITNDDEVVTGLGFDIDEDSCYKNEVFMEMLNKFTHSKRKTRLKRWFIYDNVKQKVNIHEEE